MPVPPDPNEHIRDEGVAEAAPPPYDEGVKESPYRVDHGVAEAAPPPYDPDRFSVKVPPPPPPPPPPPIDEAKKFRHDHGVAEAAPPPYDKRRVPTPVDEPLKPPPPPFLHDHGVAEAAPPPYDRYRHDGGVAEAAPPPVDPYPIAALMQVELRTSPTVPLTMGGKRVQAPLRFKAGGQPIVIGDPGKPISARLRLLPRAGHGPTVRIESATPLTVRFQGNAASAPWTGTLPHVPGRHTILLENPETGDRIQVHLMLDD